MCQNFRFLVIFFASLLGGCAIPAHNNALIFATTQDIGFGVSTPSASDPTININLGYKQRQAAWVPLWANSFTGGYKGAREAMECISAINSNGENKTEEQNEEERKIGCKVGPKFVAQDFGGSNQGGTSGPLDAYSTFASFGGNFSGGGDNQVASANGVVALGSFFATGVAAQNLTKNENIASAVSVGNNNSEKKSRKTEPEQFPVIDNYINITAEKANDTTKINEDCLNLLIKDSRLTDAQAKEINSFDKSKVDKWLAQIKSSELIKNDLTYIAREADYKFKILTGYLENCSRLDAVAAVCKQVNVAKCQAEK